MDETSKSFPKFNATGHGLLITFRSPGEEQEQTAYLKERITALTNYLVHDVRDRDLVGLRIRNTENVQDKVVGISIRCLDQLKPDVVWSDLGKVVQSNARFVLGDRLEVHLDHVRMPVGNGCEKTKGRSLNVKSAIEKSFVVKTAFLCLAHALIIAIAKVNGDPKYAAYSDGKCLKQPVQDILSASGVNLTYGGGLNQLEQFQNYLSDYKIIVYGGLSPDRVILVEIPFRTRNCTSYVMLGTTMSLQTLMLQWPRGTYVTRVTHCTTLHTSVAKLAPCLRRHHPVLKISQSCGTCNRWFLSEKCFQNHLILKK